MKDPRPTACATTLIEGSDRVNPLETPVGTMAILSSLVAQTAPRGRLSKRAV